MARQIVTIIVTGSRNFCIDANRGYAFKGKQDESDRFFSVHAA